MKQTTNYQLNMPEVSDGLSVVPLNENTQKIDNLLHGMIKVACGSYKGDGTLTREIETPGFTPCVVLMRTKGDWCDGGLYYYQTMGVKDGWCLWMGEETMTVSANSNMDMATSIVFEAKQGSLSWNTSSTGTCASRAINNDTNQTYQWVAFGVVQE